MFKKRAINQEMDDWDESSGLFDDSANSPQILDFSDNLDISDDWDTPVQQKPSVKPGWIRIAAISGSALAILLIFVIAINSKAGEKKTVVTTSPTTHEAYTLNTPTITASGEKRTVITTSPATHKAYILNTPTITAPQNTEKPAAISDKSKPTTNTTKKPVVSDNDTLNCPWYAENMRYYYFQLNEKGKKCFGLLYNAIMSFKQEVSVSRIQCTEEEIKRVTAVLRRDCPELFQWDGFIEYTTPVGGTTVLSARFNYRLQQDEYEKRCRMIRTITDQIKAAVAYPRDDYSVEYATYSWLINHCNYKILEDESTAFADSAICDGIAQCAGYSRAFSLLLRTMGVKSIEVASIPEENHQWNIVSIGGKWYQCDVTWDDCGEKNKLFGDGQNENLSFLNLPDRLMNDHTQDKDGFTRPSCTAIEANYVYQKGIYISALRTDADTIDLISKEIQKKWNRGERRFIIMWDGINDYTVKKIAKQIRWPGTNGNTYWTKDHSHCLFFVDGFTDAQ